MTKSVFKTVFRQGEVIIESDNKVVLEPPIMSPEDILAMQMKDTEEIPQEVYEGPTVEDLRREAEQFKIQWEAEREMMLRSAKLEVDNIIQKAEDEAAQEVNRRLHDIEHLKLAAQAEADKIIADAKQKAQEMTLAAQTSIENDRKKALEEGEKAGREAGFQHGKTEADRLIARTRSVLERAQEKFNEMIVETEHRIIDMVILIARKVIKYISEHEREVIIANIKDALDKVKGRGDIVIRVHTADLQVSTEHLKDFIHALEGSNIQVQEDSATVDQGGCIIETDFGEIDARIASQLTELETKIREVSPVKVKPKSSSKKREEM